MFPFAMPSKKVAAPTVTYLDAVGTGANQTTYTFSGLSFGAADANRRLIVFVGGQNNSRTISSVTIGGVTATALVTQTDVGGGTFGWFIAAVPTGTSGSVVITWSGSQSGAGCILYGSNDLGSSTPLDTDSGGEADTSVTVTLNKGNGFVLAAYGSADTGASSVAWSGDVTEDVDGIQMDSSRRVLSAASGVTTGGGTATATGTANGGSSSAVLAVSFA